MKRLFYLSLILSLSLTCMPQKKGNKQSWQTPPEVMEGLNPGNKAPELSYKNPNDSVITLSSLRGKIVLIDFWASWCGPCRRENPNVVAAYQKYKAQTFKGGEKGFAIYSVSLDMNKSGWVAAIAKDQLVWPWHVSDLKYWSSMAASQYGVESIPTNWLIDGRGVIIARDLRGPDLEKKIESLLATGVTK